MIRRVHANNERFRNVEFTSGLNIVLADRASEATQKDTRNGLGKSTLINIIHFCLGSRENPNTGLRVSELKDWRFTLDTQIRGEAVSVDRAIDLPNKVVSDAPESWFGQESTAGSDSTPGQIGLVLSVKTRRSVNDWKALLGWAMYNIQPGTTSTESVTFRNLVSYDIRRNQFHNPFENYPRQFQRDLQISNAYLLDMNWEHAAAWQRLKDRKKDVDAINRAINDGENLLANMLGSPGELETERVRLKSAVERTDEELKLFQVHPQYLEIQSEANDLTRAIHDLNNRAIQLRRLIDFHDKSVAEEAPAHDYKVVELYEHAGADLPGPVVKRLEDVRVFHAQITRNRRDYLRSEATRLQQDLSDTNSEIRRLSERRSKLMKVLDTHGALEEYSELQGRNTQQRSKLEAVENRIEQLESIETKTSRISIEREQLYLDAQRDLKERTALTTAQALFNSNSEALYEAPGNLIVDLDRQSGYKFRIDIKREGSSGIDKMKVFCYDLMRAELWSAREIRPGFLIHDSDIFAGVDERQVARALELAERKSRECGFQYIVCLNSDQVPRDEFSEDFDFDSFVRLTLTDDSPEGSLLGMRF